MVAVGLLHFVADGVVADMITRYRGALAPGSVLVVNHASDEHDDPELARRMRDGAIGYRGTATELMLRSRADAGGQGEGELRALGALAETTRRAVGHG